MTGLPQVICKHDGCRKVLTYLGELNAILYYEDCPKHPYNKRPGGVTVRFERAAQGGSFGIPRSTLEAAGGRVFRV